MINPRHPSVRNNHPGFNAAAGKIATTEGIPDKNARAILANATRNASPAAKKASPRLGKVR